MTSFIAGDEQRGGSRIPEQPARPLVSVGLPTYNRAPLLRRAVQSVLSQDYDNVELVISDNASSDETRVVCEELARRDTRVRYIRQPTNIGPTANYAAVFRESHGEFYMNFADDDWLGQSYISECVRALLDNPDLILVCGKSRYYSGDTCAFEQDNFSLLQATGRERILNYYQKVSGNGMFHGVSRRQSLAALPPMRNTFANDWLHMAAVAFMGKVRVLENVVVNRSLGGTSTSNETIVEGLGLPPAQARFPGYSVVLAAFEDVAWLSPAYRSVGLVARLVLAIQVAMALRRKLEVWTRLYFTRMVSYRLGEASPYSIVRRGHHLVRSVASLHGK